ncbi:MAG: L-2-hydroxyglutarate oxidase [SAR202 cluster bacterium]|nr:L-2-hydroxyglutarate oxidase [SAR202 cluster bacterium]MQF92987.1 L-2-hydroxyglutarate oxidase [SAR202 cluster bacterium]|tara:strand:- start:7961 stop:9172 length:1212 start_codon:yes stop_codon:yes gene_type:complete
MLKNDIDLVIIGGGIIGLATANEILRAKKNINIVVLEKSSTVASQQSGHNSGVIHSGIYYKPGSFKAEFCVEGRRTMTEFCEENEIPVWTCGKLIVATKESDLPKIDNLYERGTQNKVKGLRVVPQEEIKEIEPHVSAIKALHAPGTGIVDYIKVTEVYADQFRHSGGEIFLDTEVIGATESSGKIIIKTNRGEIETKKVINCAGLHSDRIAKMFGLDTNLKIIPFRGEYYTLKKSKEYLVKGLIYPVPNPELPFLGVHFTQTMKGYVEAGPNAVLATKREGYRKRDISIRDSLETFTYSGFWNLLKNDWKTGIWEINRSLRKSVFVKSLRELIPEVNGSDLDVGGSGVRAQAVAPDGTLIDDFKIEGSENAIHVLNAPSPGATSSLVIGKYISNLAVKQLGI